MAATSDFNYKVALASGLRELQAGRLRQAEQQFAYLCEKFPDAPGGYRGVAKVRLEEADRPAALAVLRDGAARLAKVGDHAAVVALLGEALQLEPLDLAAHRRLAAAHALAGETDAAVAEYARFARALARTDPQAARRETRYGLDSLGPLPGLVALSHEVGLDGDRLADAPAHEAPPATAPGHASADARPALLAPVAPEPLAAAAPDPGLASPDPDPRPTALAPETSPAAAAAPAPADDDPFGADERAAVYIAAGDPRAAQAALVAARQFIADGRTNAASDLLLQLIASGLADHQAQRLLVDVVSAIGKRDVARAKCALLAEALRLDGQAELAVEVERLAQAV